MHLVQFESLVQVHDITLESVTLFGPILIFNVALRALIAFPCSQCCKIEIDYPGDNNSDPWEDSPKSRG